MNSTGATATHDIGGDGKAGSINQYVARDALGFNLNYFHGDYKPINAGVTPFAEYRSVANALPDSVYRPLYNGNISSMATHIRMFDTQGHVPIFYNYRYDQLNRLVKQDAYFNFNAATNAYTGWAKDQTFHEEASYDANGNIQTYIRNTIIPDPLMDDLTYNYYPGTNRLKQVTDKVSDSKYGNPWQPIKDIDSQSDSNYVYDPIGNIIADKAEGITSIKWNVYGKITEINRTATSANAYTKIVYSYDAQGNRISKISNQGNGKQSYTWYVRDAQGNLMSTYIAEASSPAADTSLAGLFLTQDDVQIYGSSRLGSLFPFNSQVDGGSNTGPYIHPDYHGTTFYRGHRQYELSNHLGNVLTVISDKKLGVPSGGSLTLPGGFTIPAVSYYEPEMLAANDYYPFGMLSRTIGNSVKYKFGFNGKENDNEVKGLGSQQDYGMRVYDPRIGRFLSVDPLTATYPWYTPYQFAGNSPIANIDLDGAEPKPATTGKENEGKSETTNQEVTNSRGDYVGTKTTTWYYHKGGLQIGTNGKITRADWYNSEDYAAMLSETNAAAALADGLGLYASTMASNGKRSVIGDGKEQLQRFVESGLNENTTKHLIAAARIEANRANDYVTGRTPASGFNVEDMLGVGLLMKQGIKFLAGVTMKNFAPKVFSSVVQGIEQSALDRLKIRLLGLGDRKYKIDAIKAFGSRTKGTQKVISDVDIVIITNQAKEMILDARINRILNEIKNDFYNATKKQLDLNIHKSEEIGAKTLFKNSDLKNF